MNSKRYIVFLAIISALAWSVRAVADEVYPPDWVDPEHGETHTHVGVDPSTNQLVLFSAPTFTADEGGATNLAYPNWPTCSLDPQFSSFDGSPILNKSGQQLYLCDWPDGWFGAHPYTATDQLSALGGADSANPPGWDISIVRLSSSSPNLFGIQESDSSIVLGTDGSKQDLGKVWEEWLETGNGGWGGWTPHYHMWWAVWANSPGENFSVTVAAIDTGTTGYLESAPYTFNFVTTPEPMSLALLASGAALIRLRSKRAKI
jgi:hypothetical protein